MTSRRQFFQRIAPPLIAVPLATESTIRSARAWFVDQELDPLVRMRETQADSERRYEQATRLAALGLTFPKEAYVRWIPPSTVQCRFCGQDHAMYTHGCMPTAFPIGNFGPDGQPELHIEPVQGNEVPIDVVSEYCRLDGAHIHHPVEWV